MMLGTIDWSSRAVARSDIPAFYQKTEILVCFDLKKINSPNLVAEFFVLLTKVGHKKTLSRYRSTSLDLYHNVAYTYHF